VQQECMGGGVWAHSEMRAKLLLSVTRLVLVRCTTRRFLPIHCLPGVARDRAPSNTCVVTLVAVGVGGVWWSCAR
jgi:hypothetical protein